MSNNELIRMALVETMAMIPTEATPAWQYRVTINGSYLPAGMENETRKYLKENWAPLVGKYNERHISPCGSFRSLVLETGVVMITTMPKEEDHA